MAVSCSDNLAKEICDALGLKHVRKLDLHFEAGGVATVEAEIYLEEDGVRKLPAVLKKFNLIPIVGETSAIGDEFKSFTTDTITLNINALDAVSFTKALKENTGLRAILKDGLK
jgi:hypothetical protein